MAALHPSADQIQLVDVLAAFGHPIRAAIVYGLRSGDERYCAEVMPDLPKSTMTGHWRVLRESGVIHQRREGRKLFMSLRRAELDARFPGLLDMVIAEQGPGEG